MRRAPGLRAARPPRRLNAVFIFEFDNEVSDGARDDRRTSLRQLAPRESIIERSLDFEGAVALVSCVESKRSAEAPAKDLYVSPWFYLVRQLVESSGAPWYILSAFYGLLRPDQVVAPYDYTLNQLGVRDRQAWAERVLADLMPILGGKRRVIFFAGQRYREFLISPIAKAGGKVIVPMEGMRQGEQLQWLGRAD